jgi:hypothetical protein
MVGATVVTALFVLFIEPLPLPVGALVFAGTIVAIAIQPRYGLYLILFLSLLGDSVLMPWYPFVKNLSSQESLLYINGAVIVSPMECYLGLIIAMWLGKAAMQRKLEFYRGELFWPAIAFAMCMVFGLVYGLVTGGDANIALWEVRPIFLLPIILVLTSNLLAKPNHVIQLMWVVFVALFIEGLVGSYAYLVILGGNLHGIEAITEHSAAIHMNTLFTFVIAAYLYRASPAHRILIPLMAPVVLLEYLATQRRAAYLSLGIAIAFIFVLMYFQYRRLFWTIVPVLLILVTAYLGAFWNAGGALAMPANAVKSIIAPDEGGKDYQSNLYRVLENRNVVHTIRTSPLTGVGFGQKFHILVSMPDISFFAWWEYIVHNSILWTWMQTGILGFVSMIFLAGLSIMAGIRAFWQLPNGTFRAVILAATLFIVMHFMYAYVDMSWDTQSMLYLGSMMGVINCAEYIAGRQVEMPAKRWPWQNNSVLDKRPTIATRSL